MNRKVITGIMLTLLFMGMLPLVFNIQPVEANPITIVVPDDYEKIQWAIGNATDGDTIYVRAGIYYENLFVNKALSLNGENKSTTIIDGNKNGSCIYVDGADNVRITGFKIQHGYEQGISVMSSQGTIISGNTITLNIGTGIRIYGCTDVIVNENEIVDNFGLGVRVFSSSWNNVSSNRISRNGFGISITHSHNSVVSNNLVASNNQGPGIHLFFSPYSILQDNNITDNLWNLEIEGDFLLDFLHEIDLSNTIDGKPIYYLKNQKNLVVNPSVFPDIGYLGVINCNNITVEDLNIKKNGQGLLIAYTHNSVVHNVSVSNNKLGIDLCQSDRNVIAGNNASGNSYRGIVVSVSSDNTVCNNTILNNGQVGILLDSSNDNNVSANIVQNHNYGIYISNSKYNIILKNLIHNNDRGISLWSGSSYRECTENTIVGNQISNCKIGIDSRYSDNNIVYHNDFLSNTEQVFSYDSTNLWDDGYPSGGNYWSDYAGVDLYGGPHQNETGSDGIGDTPYFIDEDNQDNYPLMNPWTFPAEPTTWTVNDDGPADFIKIQDAINAASPRDTIFVYNGTYYEHLIINKNDLTLLGEDKGNTIIDGNGTESPVYIIADSVTVTGFKIQNSKFEYLYSGIRVNDSNYNNITDNTLTNNQNGICLTYSESNIIYDNMIISNNWNGILLKYSSSHNMISSNTILDNRNGIRIEVNSNNNHLLNNYIADCESVSVTLMGSQNNSVIGNTLNNCFTGIYMGDKNGNMNVIYHNNFLDNTCQATCYSTPNMWDDDYPSGGNYWSDYAGVDLHNGPCQNETGSDGIGDTPYIIDENNQDDYPLMEPWSPTPPSPVEATQELIETIETWNLSKGLETSLTSKLDNVIHQLNKGNENVAINKLTALMNQVEALRDKKITNEQADELISEAQRIIDLING